MARAPEVHDEDVEGDGGREEVHGRADPRRDPHLPKTSRTALQKGENVSIIKIILISLRLLMIGRGQSY